MAQALRAVFAIAASLGSAQAAAGQDSLAAQGANPIRKVVTLMQNMQKEITAEGEKEKELFDKFMCFCNSNSGEMAKAVADGKAKAEELSAKLKAETAEKSQTDQDLIAHKKDREEAEKDLKEAESIRTKEAAEYAESAADSATNIKAVGGAVGSLEQGMGAASLMQLPLADHLSKLFDEFPFQDENDRRNLLSFFQGGGDYVPQGGQIVGILKAMKDEMESSAKEATEDEEKAVAGFASLKASKEQEQKAAAQAIEEKLQRTGELGVSVVETADILEDTEQETADTEKFISQLDEQCATKEKEWAERQKVRNEEITAISEAIGILNDDDALDIFKKAIPSAALTQASMAFLQRSEAEATPLRRAAAILSQVVHKPSVHSSQLGLMLFSLRSQMKRAQKGKVVAKGFEGVTKMIDDMVVLEGKEQSEDDKQKPWCNGEFDKSASEEASEKSEIEDLKANLEEKADQIAEFQEEIATNSQEIKDLDKAVSEATEQRKEDHEDYVEELRMSQVAVTLVDKAKNRLNKFYNPVLYKAEPKRERTMEEKIIDGGFFAQVRRLFRVAPGEAPETFDGEYEKSGKSSGVIALMDSIIRELNQDIKDAEYDEKTAQKDYQELMASSQEKRLELTKSIKSLEAAKADLAVKREDENEKEQADEQDVLLIGKHVMDLHGECDFILENYDVRREARANELEQLKNAKSALAGAKV